ncbi:MAG: carboxypeptidase regulatory-like domain-containing protein [Pirellulaceae bacterium]|nr:carboxypeptidase regulatory-like domain-containing protein [Pirellulaceae bacterium]
MFSLKTFMGLTLLSLVMVVGCTPSDQPEVGRVTGKVTLDGQPLSGVIVNFQPESGRASTAETDAEGNYDLIYIYGTNGAKVGKNSVSFRWPDGAEGKKPLPKKYTGVTDTTVEVKSGSNKLDWELTSK